jgi:hypothetical protein
MIEITNKEKKIYLESLQKKIYAILSNYEKYNNIVSIVYLDGLLMNIGSADELFDGMLINLIIKLYELKNVNLGHRKIREIVLDSCEMIDKLIKEVSEIECDK